MSRARRRTGGRSRAADRSARALPGAAPVGPARSLSSSTTAASRARRSRSASSLGGGDGSRAGAVSTASTARREPQLVHVATDGETYGHHFRGGDRALAEALDCDRERQSDARLTNYGEFLERFSAPARGSRSSQNTSWSCAHGVGPLDATTAAARRAAPRRASPGGAPLREALDWLRDTLAPLFEAAAARSLARSVGRARRLDRRRPRPVDGERRPVPRAPRDRRALGPKRRATRARPPRACSATRCSCTRAAAGSSTIPRGSRRGRSCATRRGRWSSRKSTSADRSRRSSCGCSSACAATSADRPDASELYRTLRAPLHAVRGRRCRATELFCYPRASRWKTSARTLRASGLPSEPGSALRPRRGTSAGRGARRSARSSPSLDPRPVEAVRGNPGGVPAPVSPERLADAAARSGLPRRCSTASRRSSRWKTRAIPTTPPSAASGTRGDRIAYFSAEFGLTESLPIYAGGLGVLAGDVLKSASDLGLPLVGVGLFYREGYFRQLLDEEGGSTRRTRSLDPEDLPLSLPRDARTAGRPSSSSSSGTGRCPSSIRSRGSAASRCSCSTPTCPRTHPGRPGRSPRGSTAATRRRASGRRSCSGSAGLRALRDARPVARRSGTSTRATRRSRCWRRSGSS